MNEALSVISVFLNVRLCTCIKNQFFFFFLSKYLFVDVVCGKSVGGVVYAVSLNDGACPNDYIYVRNKVISVMVYACMKP